MASTCSTALSISSSSSSLVDAAKGPRQPAAVAASSAAQCVTLTTLPPLAAQSHARPSSKAATYCRKIARNVMTMATSGDASAPADVVTTELPEFIKTVQEAWDKVEDKYAVSSLAAAGALAIWSSSGMISAIDRLPLIPGVLEIVGIGYTGWFAYKNLILKPDREALIQKVKATYKDIIGSS